MLKGSLKYESSAFQVATEKTLYFVIFPTKTDYAPRRHKSGAGDILAKDYGTGVMYKIKSTPTHKSR